MRNTKNQFLKNFIIPIIVYNGIAKNDMITNISRIQKPCNNIRDVFVM